MRICFAWLIILFEYGCMPIVAGLLWCKETHKLGIAKLYVYGYVTLLGIFMPVCTAMIHIGQSLSHMSYLWLLINAVLVAGLVVKMFCKKTMYKDEMQYIASHVRYALMKYKGMICLCIVLLIISVLFILPSMTDETPEIVGVAVATNSMYGFEPYLIRPYEQLCKKAYFPLEMFYAVVSKISGMHSATLVHYALPIFLIPFYGGIGWILGAYFFRKEENCANKQRLFVDFWMLIGTVIIGENRSEAYGIFRNIWNVWTLFISCFLPLILYAAMRLIDVITKKD